MGIIEIISIAVGLAMDAFAVSICKGLALGKLTIKHYLIVGVWFGGFQALMPLLGYLLGTSFSSYIRQFDHYVAFVLLAIIGANMIKEALEADSCDKDSASLGFAVMLMMAVATSIDALAVGVTFAFYNLNIIVSVLLIGTITFVISALGVKIGSIFGTRYKRKAEFFGGSILIILAIKLLLEGILVQF